MEKQEHGARLKRAMGQKDVSRQQIADTLTVSLRTVTNWTTGSTMPSERQKALLRKIIGDYDALGDQVELAVRGSDLIEWRQDAVVSFYKKNLHEQRGEVAG